MFVQSFLYEHPKPLNEIPIVSQNTTITIRGDRYDLEFHGVIHVTKNGQYSGCIEFDGGFGPITKQWQESAKTNAVRFFDNPDDHESWLPADEIDSIHDAIERIMPTRKDTR